MKYLIASLLVALLAIPALAQHNEEAQAAYKLAEREFNRQKYEEAMVHYDKAIEIDPAWVNAHLRRAFCLSMLKRYEDAIKDYDAVLAKQPELIYALNSRGSALNKLERYDEAMDMCNQVLSLDKKNTEAYNNRGWAKEFTGDHEGACKDWKKSKSLGNEEAKIILKNTHCK